jgi:ribose 5-phosphate isomerase B
MAMTKLSLGSDHAGFEMKEKVRDFLLSEGYEVEDVGTDSTASCDYPEFADKVARLVQNGDVEAGILVCGSGIGMAMAANKTAGIRAVVCNEPLSARMSRAHNDANVLCLGGRMIGFEMAKEILRVWLTTDFEGDRHQRRVAMLNSILARNKMT